MLHSLICQNCSRPFKNKFKPTQCCGNACRLEFMKGRKRGRYGEGSVKLNGYRYLNIKGRTIVEHRYLMEQKLGRKLLLKEQVHHIDGNRSNNAIENLLLCANNGVHAKYHRKWFVSETHKQCRLCGLIKLRIEFHKSTTTKDPNNSLCKLCMKIENKKNKDRRRKLLKEQV